MFPRISVGPRREDTSERSRFWVGVLPRADAGEKVKVMIVREILRSRRQFLSDQAERDGGPRLG